MQVTQAAQDRRSVPYLLHFNPNGPISPFSDSIPHPPPSLETLRNSLSVLAKFLFFSKSEFFFSLSCLKETWDSFEEELPLKQSQEVAVFLPHPTGE